MAACITDCSCSTVYRHWRLVFYQSGNMFIMALRKWCFVIRGHIMKGPLVLSRLPWQQTATETEVTRLSGAAPQCLLCWRDCEENLSFGVTVERYFLFLHDYIQHKNITIRRIKQNIKSDTLALKNCFMHRKLDLLNAQSVVFFCLFFWPSELQIHSHVQLKSLTKDEK